MVAISTGETTKLANVHFSFAGITWLVISCVIGIGISWSGWNCRAKVSATKYTLLGVVCKFISVFINVFLWDKHASPQGLLMLFVCLVSSTAYKQAPMRQQSPPTKIAYEQIPTSEEAGCPDVEIGKACEEETFYLK